MQTPIVATTCENGNEYSMWNSIMPVAIIFTSWKKELKKNKAATRLSLEDL
jgi:hypothetical protein